MGDVNDLHSYPGPAAPPVEARRAAVLGEYGGLGLPVRQAGLDAGRIWQIMQRDKKARDGKVRMVLAKELGQVEIVDDVNENQVSEAVAYLGR